MSDSKPPPTSFPTSVFDLLRAWSEQVGGDWKKLTGGEARQTRHRITKGTAGGETARKVEDALEALERKQGTSTDLGRSYAALREWLDLGAQIGLANPTKFTELLEQVRTIAAGEVAMYRIRHPLPKRDDE